MQYCLPHLTRHVSSDDTRHKLWSKFYLCRGTLCATSNPHSSLPCDFISALPSPVPSIYFTLLHLSTLHHTTTFRLHRKQNGMATFVLIRPVERRHSCKGPDCSVTSTATTPPLASSSYSQCEQHYSHTNAYCRYGDPQYWKQTSSIAEI
jgi:hypothetical protein